MSRGGGDIPRGGGDCRGDEDIPRGGGDMSRGCGDIPRGGGDCRGGEDVSRGGGNCRGGGRMGILLSTVLRRLFKVDLNRNRQTSKTDKQTLHKTNKQTP